jgi:hypothetical protein
MGWPVFPIWSVDEGGICTCPKGKKCGRDTGKHPIGNLVPNGVLNATTDTETIEIWWEMDPRANVGIATGKIVVLDVDGKRGEDALLDAISKTEGTFPVTTEARTAGKNGGRHFYFDSNGHELHNAQPLGTFEGLDLRGVGGYVVAPPSHGTLGEYEWTKPPQETPPAPVPTWIIRLRGETKLTPPPPPTMGTITEGGRHKHLRGLICSMWSRGFSSQAVKRAAYAENEAVCHPPKEASDIEKLVNDLTTRYTHGDRPFKQSDLETRPAVHLTMTDIMAIPGEVIPYSIERVAPECEVVGWYGDGGSMKSMTMLHAARCVSREEPLFGMFEINTPGGFLYVDKENGPLRLKIRCRSLHISEEDHVHFLSKAELSGAYINAQGFKDFFLRALDGMEPRPKIACLDSWTRLLQQADENTAGDVALAMDVLDQVAREGELSIFLIHHTRKPSQGDKGESKARVRGSVDFINAVSTAFLLERKGVDILRFEQVKSRDFQYMQPCGIRAFWDNKIDGRFCFEREGEAPSNQNKTQKAISEVENWLVTHGGQSEKKDIINALSWLGGRSTIMRAIDHLIADGRVKCPESAQGRGASATLELIVGTQHAD